MGRERRIAGVWGRYGFNVSSERNVGKGNQQVLSGERCHGTIGLSFALSGLLIGFSQRNLSFFFFFLKNFGVYDPFFFFWFGFVFFFFVSLDSETLWVLIRVFFLNFFLCSLKVER